MTLIFASTEDSKQALSWVSEQEYDDLFSFRAEADKFDPLNTENPSVVFDGKTLRYYPGWLAFAPALVLPPLNGKSDLLTVYLNFLIGEPDPFFEHPHIPEDEKYLHAAFFKMQFGLPFTAAELPEAHDFGGALNCALIMLYGHFSDFQPQRQQVFSLLMKSYELAETKLSKARAVFETLNALADLGITEGAEDLAESITSDESFPQSLRDKISVLLFRLWVQESDRSKGGFEFEQKAWLIFKKLEKRLKNKDDVFHAFFFRDAAEVAAKRSFFSEANTLMNFALRIFETQDLKPLAADAHYRKAVIFQNWAAKGEPQFYGKSLEFFQKAKSGLAEMMTADREAELLQRIGIVTTEMPADPKKKPLFFAEAFRNFENALAKADDDYLKAQIQTNYAASLVKASDKQKGAGGLDKAVSLCREALEIRTAQMPEERCLTIMTLTEALLPQSELSDAPKLEAMLSEAESLTDVREFKAKIDDLRQILKVEKS